MKIEEEEIEEHLNTEFSLRGMDIKKTERRMERNRRKKEERGLKKGKKKEME